MGNMNNMTLNQAEKWLNELGITTQTRQTCLCVNRADIKTLGESESEILKALKQDVSTKLFWGGSDAEWLQLESF
jgi:hypothetical protein